MKPPSQKLSKKISSPKDSHYAKLRRNHRKRKNFVQTLGKIQNVHHQSSPQDDTLFLYGLHTVCAALNNPQRKIFQLLATRNALTRLNETISIPLSFPTKIVLPQEIDRLVGNQSVHQGIALETLPLPPQTLDAIQKSKLLIILDQVNDPHNIGAILRSAAAFCCDGIITTQRYSPNESAVLAKSASGALEHVPYIQISNLANALQEIHSLGFQTIGLSSDSPEPLEKIIQNDKIALILGSEGKGLRQKTKKITTSMAHLNMPGAIKSLNVSNAAAIALYITKSISQPNTLA
ncbi:MAG: RNA methyltransferase [Candidatus Liberibacter ctenarytainae]|uniref:RNA methyltransferase n=1 Tax=Candidatus Liberibacter ctenarytainae TaxID=2020335 RepID=A0A937ABW2_9HYPH|nr:RNA methyltransferase [Candidatus Liberibacter ctenarytainae]